MDEPAAAAGAHPRAAHRPVGDVFDARLGGAPDAVIRSPGRVNVIGDHTDYSEGFVLPVAIDRALYLAIRLRTDDRVRIWAELTDSWTEFPSAAPSEHAGWAGYIQGVAAMLARRGLPLGGFEGVLTGDLPAGAGLSSSAALELATARAFSLAGGFSWDPTEMALAAQQSENEWVGMNCGIMDQLICAAGVEGHALLIDCRSLHMAATPIPEVAQLVVLDTGTRRRLVDSAYNDRRLACEQAAAVFGVATLRDLSLERLEEERDRLDATIYRRARHVLNENAATVQAAKALRDGDVTQVGRLMTRSHASLRDDYEVTIPAVDAMAEVAQQAPGCFGARMTGAGFGGSVVALVDRSAVDAFVTKTLDGYRRRGHLDGSALPVEPSAGVGEMAP